MTLRRARLADCQLEEVDFTGSDLTGADRGSSRLNRAVFQDCCLAEADLRRATGYSIDPTRNRLRRARVSLPGLAGLLDRYDLDISP